MSCLWYVLSYSASDMRKGDLRGLWRVDLCQAIGIGAAVMILKCQLLHRFKWREHLPVQTLMSLHIPAPALFKANYHRYT